MTRWACAAALVLAVGGAGCHLDASIGRAGTGGSGSGSGGTSAGSSSASHGGSGSASHGGSGSASGGATGGSGNPHGSSGSGSGGVHDVCTPTAMDTACATCRKMQCCSALQACEADPACPCMWTCTLAGVHTQSECATSCGYTTTTLDDVHTCTSTSCPHACTDPLGDGPP